MRKKFEDGAGKSGKTPPPFQDDEFQPGASENELFETSTGDIYPFSAGGSFDDGLM